MNICEKEKCTGCAACYNACPTEAISITQDEEGFDRPEVNLEKCTNCGLCGKICPQNYERGKTAVAPGKYVFACWLKDETERISSTSGGAFSAFAKIILQHDGAVFGAAFDDSLSVSHQMIDTIDELWKLKGSKYVQSSIRSSYRQVKKLLTEGRKVLFSGTPCQIDGLYHYLGKRYPGQLWTIDLVCHGVPSPAVFRSYLQNLEEQYQAKAEHISFRNKTPGWFIFGMKIAFRNGTQYENDTYHDPFLRGFLRNYFLRRCCYQCAYANENRPADITLSDFWSYEDTCKKDRDDDKGVSMVMLNTDNAGLLFSEAKEYLTVFKRPRSNGIASNKAFSTPFPAPDNRAEFWRDYNSLEFKKVIERYCYPEEPDFWMKNRAAALERKHSYQDRHPVVNRLKQTAKRIIGKKRQGKNQ